jgi:hypothetical protein
MFIDGISEQGDHDQAHDGTVQRNQLRTSVGALLRA